VPVRNALEVDQIFDHISYLKGSSVIRMLGDHLGNQTFLKGVAAYLKKHAYGMDSISQLEMPSNGHGQGMQQLMICGTP
jgi:aminopeptidase N